MEHTRRRIPRRPILALALAAGACAPRPTVPPAPAAPDRHAQFEPEIRQLEAAARADPPAPGGVLFVGSSSIRLWETLGQDFPGVRALNRGFGGSTLADAVHFAPRIVVPARPRLVVLYAGDNDLAEGATPARVLADLRRFVDLVRGELPGTGVVYVAVKPSPARWALVERARETNRLVQEYAHTSGGAVRFADVFTPMLGADGRPRPELYAADGLHLSAAGYALWRDVLAPLVR